MAKKLTLTFTPTPTDYTRAYRAFQLRQRRIQLFIGGFAAVLLIGLALLALPRLGFTPFGLPTLLFGLFGLLYLLYWNPRTIGQQMRRKPRLAEKNTWDISPTSIHMHSQHLDARVLWATYEELLVTRDYYLLVYRENRRMFQILPRRAFTDPEHEADFLKLAAKRLKFSGKASLPWSN